MEYRVGDKVRIKSLDWYNENKDEFGEVRYEEYIFVKSMVPYCGSILTIETKIEDYYQVKENTFWWTDEMIEGLVEEESKYGTASYTVEPKSNVNCSTREMIEGLVEEEVDLIPKFGEYSDNEPLDIPTMTTEFIKEHGLPCPDGYEFKDENGNVINTTKIVLEKKKTEYPKTYEECCKIIGIDEYDLVQDYRVGKIRTIQSERIEKLNILNKLLICRDAYWKIAGEKMELGKPWKPNWTDDHQKKYTIYAMGNKVVRHFGGYIHSILAFPTEEMRDAFKENFDPDIEICKEFL